MRLLGETAADVIRKQKRERVSGDGWEVAGTSRNVKPDWHRRLVLYTHPPS